MLRDCKPWAPVLLWLGFIFLMSSDAGSSVHTGQVLGPLLRWMDPGIAERTVDLVHLIVRKCAHITEYAALAILLRRAIMRSAWLGDVNWSWPVSAVVWLAATSLAVVDEVHQSFVSTRTAMGSDVLIDSAGAFLGLACVYGLQVLRGALEEKLKAESYRL